MVRRSLIGVRTVAAPPEHGEMRPIEQESLLPAQPFGQIVGQRMRGVDHPTAGVAHHVDVVVVGRPERGRTVPQVGMANQADALEQFECAVDGSDVYARNSLADLFRCGMTELAHRRENVVTLRGHPHATRTQAHGQIGVVSHRVHGRAAPVRPPVIA